MAKTARERRGPVRDAQRRFAGHAQRTRGHVGVTSQNPRVHVMVTAGRGRNRRQQEKTAEMVQLRRGGGGLVSPSHRGCRDSSQWALRDNMNAAPTAWRRGAGTQGVTHQCFFLSGGGFPQSITRSRMSVHTAVRATSHSTSRVRLRRFDAPTPPSQVVERKVWASALRWCVKSNTCFCVT